MDLGKSSKRMKMTNLVEKFHNSRQKTAGSVKSFVFNKRRVRLLNQWNDIQEGSKGILYWMFRDVRIQGYQTEAIAQNGTNFLSKEALLYQLAKYITTLPLKCKVDCKKVQRLPLLEKTKLLSEQPNRLYKAYIKSFIFFIIKLRYFSIPDNWALIFAQRTALKNNLPLHVCFCIVPSFLDATMRHYKFLTKGLMEVEDECKTLNINFHLLQGEPNIVVLNFAKQYKMGAIITDFSPLKVPLFWVNDLQKNLPNDIPICQVDAHNIVPCWYASSKLEFSAKTIRSKINSKLKEFLTEFPLVAKHSYSKEQMFEENNWETALQHVQVDTSVDEVLWAKAGYNHGIEELQSFIENRLKKYEHERNNPTSDALSNLSSWFNFGMISVQRCILEIMEYTKLYPGSVKSFMEETIIRRELSDNFCFYNEDYDVVSGAHPWAIKTINQHRKDKREYTYTLEQFEHSHTHDDLWNASQNQMVKTGKMHGFLRMYWAKKILQWTESFEIALQWANYLNNKYSLDGCDPNGYVGCMWSICGVHDHAWKEREVFGKIRYMNYAGCTRKFNVQKFVALWGKRDQ